MDAEARQLMKGIQNHNSTRGCEKCEVDGIRYRHRTVYLDFDAQLRHDEDFADRLDPAHHNEADIDEPTPLEQIETRMISDFVLDPMHLVDMGLFKRWLKFILDMYGRNPAVISAQEKIIISEKIDFISFTLPQECTIFEIWIICLITKPWN
ncbi:hypothetical protein FOCC_FOCC014640 [Frankliniella occidentalis]|nr:hypothetical protein FOCC_FOCC014640 [Frankliniella occidentalis]